MKKHFHKLEIVLLICLVVSCHAGYGLIKNFDVTELMYKYFTYFISCLLVVGLLIKRIIEDYSEDYIATNIKTSIKTIVYKIFLLFLLIISTVSFSVFIVELGEYGFGSNEIIGYQIASIPLLMTAQFILILDFSKL